MFRGVSVSPNDLHYEGRKVIVHGFPIGIEPSEFKDRLASKETQDEQAKLENNFKGQKIIVGVDRLDYIKGIPQKLKAFDRFLTENPDWLGKVTLIQLAIPTRADVGTYQRLREEVERLVGHINGKHGQFSFSSIQLSPEKLPLNHLLLPPLLLFPFTLNTPKESLNTDNHSKEPSHTRQSTTCTAPSHLSTCVRCTRCRTCASSHPCKTA